MCWFDDLLLHIRQNQSYIFHIFIQKENQPGLFMKFDITIRTNRKTMKYLNTQCIRFKPNTFPLILCSMSFALCIVYLCSVIHVHERLNVSFKNRKYFLWLYINKNVFSSVHMYWYLRCSSHIILLPVVCLLFLFSSYHVLLKFLFIAD